MSSPEATFNGVDSQATKSPLGEPKKRKRGATRLSCAECRRLKLRCDRAIPCGSCVKRGCAAICPDGSLTTGKGNRANRFILSSTQDLHDKILELSNRVRELEEGLRESHARQSQAPHPLLSDELLRIKAPLQREGLSIGANGSDEQGGDVVDSFGSLAISDTGRTNFFGQASNSFYFLQNEGQHEQDRENRLAALRKLLPPEVLALAGFFPIAPNISPTLEVETERADRLRSLFWYLPPADEAAELRHIYFHHAAWMYNPVSLDNFNELVYFQFYNPNAAPPIDDPLLSHQLALMFMVLAIGCLMDIKRPAYNIEAEKYHQLARAALFQSPVFEEPTLHAVQSLYLMAFYLFLSERHGSGVGTRWALMGLAVKLGISIGLHRDAVRWNVEPAEIGRRRQTFWELYTYDFLQSYTLGRPPSFSLNHIDCKKPYVENPNNDETFHWWKHSYASECMHTVYDQAFGAKMPTYNTVLQLDRKLRSFYVPPLLQIAGFGSTDSRMGSSFDTVPLILQRHLVLAIRESNLLYMHRGFFARAINDHAKDPLGSPYGSSFIAAYRSAGSLVALMKNIHSQLKELTERMWFLWTHLFSCSIILGSIVTRCPSMSLAPSALVQLESACELFAKVAHFFHAERTLTIMLNLRKKAQDSLTAHRNTPPSRQGTLGSEPTTPADDNDELSTLGGKTRLVAQKEKSVSPVIGELSPTSLNPIVPFPMKQEFDQNAHPYVLEYLRTFASHNQNGAQHNGSVHTTAAPQTQTQAQPSSPYDHASFSQDVTMASTSSAPYLPGTVPYRHQLSPMEGMPQQNLPQYFPVFDYGYVGGDNFSAMSPEAEISGRSYSPEAPNMQSAWQDFVAQIGQM